MRTVPSFYEPNKFTPDEVRAFWDSVAEEYAHEEGSLKETHFQRFERAFGHIELSEEASVLNVWSRNGEAIAYFRERAPGVKLRNAEISPRLIEKARERYPEEEFVETDLVTLPFEGEEFDLVLSLETLEHTPDPLAFLREIHRVLKPGGRLVMSLPPAAAEPFLRLYELLFRNHGEGPHRFLSSREVKRLLRAAGFDLLLHEATLFVPVGPRFLRRLDPFLERILARTPLREFGIRHFYVAQKPRGAGPWLDLMRSVVEAGLCARCGTCVGVCPGGVFAFKDEEGECLPEVVNPEACSRCGLCTEGCPGGEVSFRELHEQVGETPASDERLGPFRRILSAAAKEAGLRSAGASGGVVTTLLCDLLERGEITGAVVLAPHPERPWRPWPRVARMRREFIVAAQSKYCVTLVNVFLRDVDPKRDRLAVVALPCQVHALRKLERKGLPASGAISLVVGLYCGNQLYFGATRSFLRRNGVSDLTRVSEIRYRDGPWPGNVRCLLKDGTSFAVPKFHFNHLISFYVVERCLLCTDLACEGADLSVGDAWDSAAEGGGGFSLVVTRSERGEAVLSSAVERGLLETQELPLEGALRTHAHGFDLKKTGAFLRLKRRRRKGEPVPRYDLSEPETTFLRRLSERFVDFHFAFLRTRFARRLLDLVPFRAVGAFYTVLRFLWKSVSGRKYREGRKRGRIGEKDE